MFINLEITVLNGVQTTTNLDDILSNARTHLEHGASALKLAAGFIGNKLTSAVVSLGEDSEKLVDRARQLQRDHQNHAAQSPLAPTAQVAQVSSLRTQATSPLAQEGPRQATNSNRPSAPTEQETSLPFAGINNDELQATLSNTTRKFMSLSDLGSVVKKRLDGLTHKEARLDKALDKAAEQYTEAAIKHDAIAHQSLLHRGKVAADIARGGVPAGRLAAYKQRQMGLDRQGDALLKKLNDLDIEIANIQAEKTELKRGPSAIALRKALENAASALKQMLR